MTTEKNIESLYGELEQENAFLKQKIKELESAYEGLLHLNKVLARVHNTQNIDHFLLGISENQWLEVIKMIDESYYGVKTMNIVYIDGDVHLIPFGLPKVVIECKDNEWIKRISIHKEDESNAISYVIFEKVTEYIEFQIT